MAALPETVSSTTSGEDTKAASTISLSVGIVAVVFCGVTAALLLAARCSRPASFFLRHGLSHDLLSLSGMTVAFLVVAFTGFVLWLVWFSVLAAEVRPATVSVAVLTLPTAAWLVIYGVRVYALQGYRLGSQESLFSPFSSSSLRKTGRSWIGWFLEHLPELSWLMAGILLVVYEWTLVFVGQVAGTDSAGRAKFRYSYLTASWVFVHANAIFTLFAINALAYAAPTPTSQQYAKVRNVIRVAEDGLPALVLASARTVMREKGNEKDWPEVEKGMEPRQSLSLSRAGALLRAAIFYALGIGVFVIYTSVNASLTKQHGGITKYEDQGELLGLMTSSVLVIADLVLLLAWWGGLLSSSGSASAVVLVTRALVLAFGARWWLVGHAAVYGTLGIFLADHVAQRYLDGVQAADLSNFASKESSSSSSSKSRTSSTAAQCCASVFGTCRTCAGAEVKGVITAPGTLLFLVTAGFAAWLAILQTSLLGHGLPGAKVQLLDRAHEQWVVALGVLFIVIIVVFGRTAMLLRGRPEEKRGLIVAVIVIAGLGGILYAATRSFILLASLVFLPPALSAAYEAYSLWIIADYTVFLPGGFCCCSRTTPSGDTAEVKPKDEGGDVEEGKKGEKKAKKKEDEGVRERASLAMETAMKQVGICFGGPDGRNRLLIVLLVLTVAFLIGFALVFNLGLDPNSSVLGWFITLQLLSVLTTPIAPWSWFGTLEFHWVQVIGAVSALAFHIVAHSLWIAAATDPNQLTRFLTKDATSIRRSAALLGGVFSIFLYPALVLSATALFKWRDDRWKGSMVVYATLGLAQVVIGGFAIAGVFVFDALVITVSLLLVYVVVAAGVAFYVHTRVTDGKPSVWAVRGLVGALGAVVIVSLSVAIWRFTLASFTTVTVEERSSLYFQGVMIASASFWMLIIALTLYGILTTTSRALIATPQTPLPLFRIDPNNATAYIPSPSGMQALFAATFLAVCWGFVGAAVLSPPYVGLIVAAVSSEALLCFVLARTSARHRAFLDSVATLGEHLAAKEAEKDAGAGSASGGGDGAAGGNTNPVDAPIPIGLATKVVRSAASAIGERVNFGDAGDEDAKMKDQSKKIDDLAVQVERFLRRPAVHLAHKYGSLHHEIGELTRSALWSGLLSPCGAAEVMAVPDTPPQSLRETMITLRRTGAVGCQRFPEPSEATRTSGGEIPERIPSPWLLPVNGMSVADVAEAAIRRLPDAEDMYDRLVDLHATLDACVDHIADSRTDEAVLFTKVFMSVVNGAIVAERSLQADWERFIQWLQRLADAVEKRRNKKHGGGDDDGSGAGAAAGGSDDESEHGPKLQDDAEESFQEEARKIKDKELDTLMDLSRLIHLREESSKKDASASKRALLPGLNEALGSPEGLMSFWTKSLGAGLADQRRTAVEKLRGRRSAMVASWNAKVREQANAEIDDYDELYENRIASRARERAARGPFEDDQRYVGPWTWEWHKEDIERARRMAAEAVEGLGEGEKWEDPDYVIDDNTFGRYAMKDKREEGGKGKSWGRLTEMDDWKLYAEGATLGDVSQGGLGDCWLCAGFASAAALGLVDKILIASHPDDEATKKGCFAVRFFINGAWEIVLVDDRVPMYDGKWILMLSSTDKNEIWPSIVEKAYSKVMGSYAVLIGGQGHEALPRVTGFLTDFYHWDRDGGDAVNDAAFRYVEERFREGSTGEWSALKGAEQGIVLGHAFTLVDAREVSDGRETHKLVGIRNPWGHKTWTGDFGPNDKDRWTKRLRKELNYDPDDPKGLWYMRWSDMLEVFCGISLAYPMSPVGGRHPSPGTTTVSLPKDSPFRGLPFVYVNRFLTRTGNPTEQFSFDVPNKCKCAFGWRSDFDGKGIKDGGPRVSMIIHDVGGRRTKYDWEEKVADADFVAGDGTFTELEGKHYTISVKVHGDPDTKDSYDVEITTIVATSVALRSTDGWHLKRLPPDSDGGGGGGE